MLRSSLVVDAAPIADAARSQEASDTRRRLPGAGTVALWAFLPMLVIAIVAWFCTGTIRARTPIELSNLEVLGAMLRGFMHPTTRADSWGPMMQALAVLHGPSRDALYQALFFDSHVRFQYPPSSLLSLDLLSSIGLGHVRLLNAMNSAVYLVEICAVAAFAWLLFRPASVARGPRPAAMVAIAAAGAFVFYPDMRAAVLGQIQLWIDLLFTAAFIAWLLNRRLLAGVLIGLACTIKPQLGLLLLWALLWREWIFAAGILTSAVPVLALSVVLYGLPVQFGYLDVLSFLSRHGEEYFANNSLNGIMNGYFAGVGNVTWNADSLTAYHWPVYAATLLVTLLAMASIVLLAFKGRRRHATLADLGVVSILSVIASPVAWEHHYGLLLPIFLVALRHVMDPATPPARRISPLALCIAWLLVANFIPFTLLLSGTPLSFLQANLFLGGLLLFALLAKASLSLDQKDSPRAPKGAWRLQQPAG
jgi:alpha-1,2-mannosyltransferase